MYIALQRTRTATVIGVLTSAMLVIFGSTGAVHAAESADASITSTTAEWTDTSGGGASFAITLTNLSDTDLQVAAVTDAGAGCKPEVSPSTVKAFTAPTKVTVTLPPSCDLSDDKVQVSVSAGNAAFEVSAAKPDAPDPDWQQLWVFPITLAITIATAALVAGIGLQKRCFAPLKGLKAEWSFKDAWATNVTALGALLTGVLGSSSVVKAILGEDAEGALALSTVGVAIGAAIAVAAPVVLGIFKRGGSYTMVGVLFAGALVVTGSSGELWIVAQSGSSLDKVDDLADVAVYGAAGAAAVLLVAFVIVTTVSIWNTGTKVTPVEPDSTLIAAALHLKYCCGGADIDPADYKKLVEDLTKALNTEAGARSLIESTSSGFPSMRPARGVGF